MAHAFAVKAANACQKLQLAALHLRKNWSQLTSEIKSAALIPCCTTGCSLLSIVWNPR